VERADGARRWRWWALLAALFAVILGLAARARIDAWMLGALLLVAWGLLAYATGLLRVPRALRLLLATTLLGLFVMIWSYAAPQPRIQVSGVRLEKLPSTVSPGVLEVSVRNTGAVPADVDGAAVGYLGRFFRTDADIGAREANTHLSARLEPEKESEGTDAGGDGAPSPVRLVIQPGETSRVAVDIPPSQRSWFVSRGEATVVMAARVGFRDRLFRREQEFCVFTTPPSNAWAPCPFLND
jgi:hypothetical protein